MLDILAATSAVLNDRDPTQTELPPDIMARAQRLETIASWVPLHLILIWAKRVWPDVQRAWSIQNDPAGGAEVLQAYLPECMPRSIMTKLQHILDDEQVTMLAGLADLQIGPEEAFPELMRKSRLWYRHWWENRARCNAANGYYTDALKAYANTTHAALQARQQSGSRSDSQRDLDLQQTVAMSELHERMVILHLVINVALYAPAPWCTDPDNGLVPHVINGAMAVSLGVGTALWWTGAGALVGFGAYLGLSAVSIIATEFGLTLDNTTRKERYEELLWLCTRYVGVKEVLISQLCSQAEPGEAFVKLNEGLARDLHPRLRASPFLPTWLGCVSEIGHIRQETNGLVRLGTLGLTRIGKSYLLTCVFGFPYNNFHAGAHDAHRTTGLRVARTAGNVVVIDLPGWDEGMEELRNASAYAVGLLDISIVVLDYAAVESDKTISLIAYICERLLASNRARPVHILLNRVDLVVGRIGGDIEQEIRERKALVVRRIDGHLRRLTGGNRVTIFTSETDGQRTFIRPAYEEADQFVQFADSNLVCERESALKYNLGLPVGSVPQLVDR
ncbi:P-loop containing nucleoside triphosphate hydrolase [Ceraceosorus bombacis]|uniref:p-loop containing nucleoside triphosphate hydrolase n=1 Tax=Ceraceosorus bombacis TaxID=401625 RepID=A0A0N7L9V3_9BASI|nr:P-loop containing nucleoside triphosphate hydrolase [Ceraceosorus bombacis]